MANQRSDVFHIDIRRRKHQCRHGTIGEMWEWQLVTQKLRALRRRSGLSKQQVAIASGWKGATSYARYENPDLFTRPVLPLDVCLRLIPALVGRGSPAITRAEVMELAGIDRGGNAARLAMALADLNTAVDEGRLKDAVGHAHIVLGHLTLMS